MTVYFAIVGHTSRAKQCAQLQAQLDGAALFLDDGSLGEWANHRRAFQFGLTVGHDAPWDRDWLVVLQDDAQPIKGFQAAAQAALEHVPAEAFMVSFYCGTSRPLRYQQPFAEAVFNAELDGSGFLSAPVLGWGVAVAIRLDALQIILDYCDNHSQPYDERLSAAMFGLGPVFYTWPSLVDHEDGTSLVKHRYDVDTKPRKARKVGLPRSWNVTEVTV